MADVTIEPGQVWSGPRDRPPMSYVVVETVSLAHSGPAAGVWVTELARTAIDQYRRMGERRMILRESFLEAYGPTTHRMPTDPPAHPRLKLVNVAHVTDLAKAHADVVTDIQIFEDAGTQTSVRTFSSAHLTGVSVCGQLHPETLKKFLLTALEERRMEIEAELVRLGVDIE